ncbi:MIP family channel protein [Streptomyces daliensis]|uniref:MIP family channel protein n=1 Tax=Streptomyces daliensis TaxID=299421 RepID=A0A8T4IPJ7_9ACTN|nr:MIP family channel protein [Streptomyces daliensis]
MQSSLRSSMSAEEVETNPQPYAAEFLGTLLLVFFAVGAAVLSSEYIGTLGVALSFGFTLLALAYAIGPISGCHVNPAVTLGMLMARRMSLHTAIRYWIAQIVGAIVGSALLFLVAKQVPGLQTDESFGSNGFGDRSAVHINAFGAFVAELILTMLLVYVVLSVTHKVAVVGFDGLPIGMALAVVHLVGIPLTGTSVNPARSIGPALFATGSALTQLWLFIVAPLIGAVLAALVHRVTHPQTGRDELANAEPAESTSR